MNISLNHLSLFHAVAEAGGVTRAAERLMVSQPAVSKQVKELERTLRVRLLERDGRGVRLTEHGRVLAGYARQIFTLLDEAEAALTDLDALRRGRLAVGVTPTIGTYVLPDVLVYFRQRFPGVRVEVETADVGRLRDRVATDRSLDLALADETLTFPGMARREFTKATFVAIAAPRHPLVRRRRVALADLATGPLVMREPGSNERSLVERFLAESGLGFDGALTLGSTEAVKRAVEGGLGIGIVPRLAIEREAKSGRLAILKTPELKLARPLFEVWDASRPRSKAARAFHCVLEHAGRGTLPDPLRTRRRRPVAKR
jgi:DNA-binding transcriptional LysR family regulator